MFSQFSTPGWMSEITSAQQLNALAASPPVQMGGIAIFACGTGKAGVDMEISDIQS